MAENSVAVRLQQLDLLDQALVLARLVESRSETGVFAPRDLTQLYVDLAVPLPNTSMSNVLASLERRGLVTRSRGRGTWRVTPLGRVRSEEAMSDFDIASLGVEATAYYGGATFGKALHTVVPPSLSPPSLLPGLRRFLAQFPFDTNVFAMTRFPTEDTDPVSKAISVARRVCQLHGLHLHLASDRAIEDDLWANVAAHMWACKYGIAFIEDRAGRGLNHNLMIEVGAMLMTGRRCALLKDRTIDRLPTDLVGRIYRSVDFEDSSQVATEIHCWIRDDLRLGSCKECPGPHGVAC